MAVGDLTVSNDLAVGGVLSVTGTVDFPGGAVDDDLVTNLNADKLDGAELSTDGTLADDSDEAVPTEKAVKAYVDDNCVVLTGAQTIAGVKTFSDGIDSGGEGTAIKFKIVEIGAWNMDTTANINVGLGISTVAQIISISGYILSDDGANGYPLPYAIAAGTVDANLGAFGVSGEQVIVSLARRTSGVFDSAGFNDAEVNRGILFVAYVDA